MQRKPEGHNSENHPVKAFYNTILIHSAKILVIMSVLKKINIAPHTAMRVKISFKAFRVSVQIQVATHDHVRAHNKTT